MVTATPPPGSTATRTGGATPAHGCVGDCDGSGHVTIATLVKGVAIALGVQPIAACPSFDVDRNGFVGVNELVSAVNSALPGCSPC